MSGDDQHRFQAVYEGDMSLEQAQEMFKAGDKLEVLYLAQDGFERAWLYTRSKVVDEDLYEWVIDDLAAAGMDVSIIDRTPHYEDREYPSV